MNKLSIRDLELNDHRVFIRVDFNVPLEGGRVMDDTRIRETLPTIEYALRHGARVILASHLGRPKGNPDPGLSLKPVAERLRMLLDKQLALGENVGFCPDCVGPEAEEVAGKLEKGQTLLLENLRFHPEEEANDEKFSKQLAKLADYYVNDAFGAAHRAHASTVGITRFVQKAHGEQIGKSLVEEDKVDLARQLLQESKSHKLKFLLPVDHVVADMIDANAKVQIISSGQPIPPNMMALDIGPRTVEAFTEE